MPSFGPPPIEIGMGSNAANGRLTSRPSEAEAGAVSGRFSFVKPISAQLGNSSPDPTTNGLLLS